MFPNLLPWINKRIYIVVDLRVSKLLTHLTFWVNIHLNDDTVYPCILIKMMVIYSEQATDLTSGPPQKKYDCWVTFKTLNLHTKRWKFYKPSRSHQKFVQSHNIHFADTRKNGTFLLTSQTQLSLNSNDLHNVHCLFGMQKTIMNSVMLSIWHAEVSLHTSSQPLITKLSW